MIQLIFTVGQTVYLTTELMSDGIRVPKGEPAVVTDKNGAGYYRVRVVVDKGFAINKWILSRRLSGCLACARSPKRCDSTRRHVCMLHKHEGACCAGITGEEPNPHREGWVPLDENDVPFRKTDHVD